MNRPKMPKYYGLDGYWRDYVEKLDSYCDALEKENDKMTSKINKFTSVLRMCNGCYCAKWLIAELIESDGKDE